MNTRMRGTRARIKIVRWLLIGPIILLLLTCALSAQRSYEAYYRYLGDYPNEANPGWHEEAQGLAHDQNNWFITQDKFLWKIPVTHDLNVSVSPGDPGIIQRRLDQVPQLANAGYDHFGDSECFEFGGQGFLLVPVEGGSCPALVVFRTDTLQYVDHYCLAGQSGAPWCAVDPQGFVYSSNFYNVSSINKYGVDWNTLRNSNKLMLTKPTAVNLSLTLQAVQGGVISPSGELFYVVCGFYDKTGPSDGIHVFDLSTGAEVQQSTNGFGYFAYEFHPGCCSYQEPEGLTIWDLDDGRAPGIRGQLHVLLLENDLGADDIYMKHYTGTIYVDRNFHGDGTQWNPFNTVAEAYNFAWDGARIKIQAGSYPETLTSSKRIQLGAEGGGVAIGK